MAIAQIINFFLQRKVTFKSNANIARAAFWYVIAYLIISISAAALQGLYKAPIYNLFMNIMGMGGTGERIADAITMIINRDWFMDFELLPTVIMQRRFHGIKEQYCVC